MIETASTPVSLYLNVVARINDGYTELLEHYKEGDTRVLYLQSFELSLSSALPKESLWDSENYSDYIKEHELELPDDPYEFVSMEEFRLYLVIYEMVMRDNGLIGTKPVEIPGVS